MSAKQGKGGNVFAAKGKAIAEQEERRRNKPMRTKEPSAADNTDEQRERIENADNPVQTEERSSSDRQDIPRAAGSAKGLQEGWTRYTITTKTDLVEDLKVYAFRNRQSIKDVVTEAFEQYLSDKDVGAR